MAKLKVPSLQHLARNWRDNPERTAKVLVRLALNPPTFNYNPLFGAVRDMLLFKQPYDQIVEGISRGVKRPGVRANILGVLPLVREHFEDISPDFVQTVDRRYYPIGRGIMVPFEPPLVYGLGGKLYFPWFSFWRRNPLALKRLSLFITLVDEVLTDDPDLADSDFHILDFSAADAKSDRELRVISSLDIPRVSEDEKRAMLATFAEGYLLAQSQLSGAQRGTRPSEEREQQQSDPAQGDMFDPNREH